MMHRTLHAGPEATVLVGLTHTDLLQLQRAPRNKVAEIHGDALGLTQDIMLLSGESRRTLEYALRPMGRFVQTPVMWTVARIRRRRTLVIALTYEDIADLRHDPAGLYVPQHGPNICTVRLFAEADEAGLEDRMATLAALPLPPLRQPRAILEAEG